MLFLGLAIWLFVEWMNGVGIVVEIVVFFTIGDSIVETFMIGFVSFFGIGMLPIT